MRFRRIAAAAAVAAVAGGGALVISSTVGSAATTPPPTPISLNLTGMASSSCPLPLNGSMAVKPGTTVQFTRDLLLNALSDESVTIKPAPNSTDPTSSYTINSLTSTNGKVSFSRAASYAVSWKTTAVPLLGIVAASQTGKLLVNSNAQNCVIAVQVPTPSVSVPVVPSPVTSTVNGIVNGVVSSVNGVLSPVNSAVGPVLGGVGGTVGGGTGLPGGGTPGGGVPGVGTSYHPNGPTVAQRTVPQGYGNGSGAGGAYVPVGSGSGAGAVTGTGSATGKSGTTGQQPIKSGGSPKTVQLASDKPRSALDGWSALIVLAAVLALSGATAFYARSYLLNPAPTKIKA